jgi:hypothetical protein
MHSDAPRPQRPRLGRIANHPWIVAIGSALISGFILLLAAHWIS